MTDIDKFRNLMIKFGIVITEAMTETHVCLSIESKTGPRNIGYASSVATFTFTDAGEFVSVGLWE